MKWRKQAMSAVLTGCLAAGMLVPAAMAAEPKAEIQEVQEIAETVLEKQSAYNAAYLLTQNKYYDNGSLEYAVQYSYVYDKYDRVKKMCEKVLVPQADGTWKEDASQQITTVYTHDANGNITKQDNAHEQHVYVYNQANQVTKETYTDKQEKENNYTAVYTYTNGLATKITTTFPNMQNIKLTTTIRYDTNGKVLKEVISYAGEDLEALTYSYDDKGNCISVKDNMFDGMPEYTTFEYDADNNCIRETCGDEQISYEYQLKDDWKAQNPTTVDMLFDDIAPTAWYCPFVQKAYDMNLMEGMGNTTFMPNKSLKRAELVQIMYNEAGRPTVTGKTSFKDVRSNQWYYNAVLWAEQNKVTSGIEVGKFGPNDVVTREQMVTILYNYENKPQADVAVLEKYPDAAKISSWAKDAMAWAVANNVVVGDQKKDGSVYLNPRNTATRAQAATVLSKYFAEEAK